jgi:putative protease
VKNFCNECYNVVYNSVPTCLFGEVAKLSDMNIKRMRLEFTVEQGKEIDHVLQMLEGEPKNIECTKGHYKRGVE